MVSLRLGVSTHKGKVNMKGKDSFSPLPLPESLNNGAAQEQASQNNAEPQRPPKQKARRKPARSNRSPGRSSRGDRESRWKRIRGRLAAKIGHMDSERLRQALLGLGVAAGVVAAILIVVKLLPITVTILAILGIAGSLRFWERLRYMPRPF